MQRAKFYDSIRQSLFKGKLSPSQVEGVESILNEWDDRNLADLRWLGYILATTYHETAKTMQPVREYGRGKGYKYGKPDPETGQVYYGRGFCQLTWKYNYKRFEDLLGVPLVNNPDLALEPKTAAQILFIGMVKGIYTSKRLSDYFNDEKDDPVNARRIVNGIDKAKLIAGYHNLFMEAINA